ncbi:hypothetical protein EZV73_27195 [Acidaminobacter sp. JC074]|uniref:hypothetical protein n=1 Tax=Acidaminobacter sp. JC074 TaxID=2530199 RepID=UPI001F10E9F7|nr:hypothetical protein [Acidaminobacter sp. JC074]MCH4891286.1 hypothetical protein [Acidaminobacter sp. JC074]
MKKNNTWKKIFKIAVAVMAIATLAKMYYEAKLLDLTIGIFNLEFGGKNIHRVSCKSLMYIMRNTEPDQLFTEEMKMNGWKLTDVYGRGHLFEKDGEEILVIAREHMGRYKVFEIQNKHYFLSLEEA